MVLKITEYEIKNTKNGRFIRSNTKKVRIEGGKIVKENYTKPEVEIEEYKSVDVITTSTQGDPADNDVPFGS